MIKNRKLIIIICAFVLSFGMASVGYGFWTDHLDLVGNADVKISLKVIDDIASVEYTTPEAVELLQNEITPDPGVDGDNTDSLIDSNVTEDIPKNSVDPLNTTESNNSNELPDATTSNEILDQTQTDSTDSTSQTDPVSNTDSTNQTDPVNDTDSTSQTDQNDATNSTGGSEQKSSVQNNTEQDTTKSSDNTDSNVEDGGSTDGSDDSGSTT